MHIKVKENKIIVEFTEREAAFIMQKVGDSDAENVSNYIKEKLIKAFSLEDIETTDIPSVGKDFNLNKIKKVTAELKKRTHKTDKSEDRVEDFVKDKASKDSTSDNLSGIENDKLEKNLNNEDIEEITEEITEEIGDELLADLLDKDLLKGRKKKKKEH